MAADGAAGVCVLKFVCWLWRGRAFWKQTARYDERHVAVLASMLHRHGKHELTCVQDGSFDVPGSIVMPESVSSLPDYLPKLWAWSPEFHDLVRERFTSIDLDVVIAGDLGLVLDRPEPFLIWNKASREPYNSSLFALDPGFGNEVWTSMTPTRIACAKRMADYWTGDQSWIAHVLGPGRETFGEETGVMQYRPALHRERMPAGMIAGFMCGPYEPISEAEHSEWVRSAWR